MNERSSCFFSLRPVISSALLATALGTVVAPIVGPARSATAQSDAEHRAENESLRTRVNDLELELKAARARISELEKRLADATARLSAAGATGSGVVPPPVEPAATLDESFANASPRALLSALAADYAATVSPVGGWSTPRERTLYFRALEKWLAGANRRFRMPVEWLVRVDQIGAVGDKSGVVRAVAIDPGNGADLGDPFDIVAPLALFKRLDASRLLDRGTTLTLRGTLLPDVTINVDREAIGAFDRPRFVGPFAELGFSIDAQSIVSAAAPNPSAPSAVPRVAPPAAPAVAPPVTPPAAPPAAPPGTPPTSPPAATPPTQPPAKP